LPSPRVIYLHGFASSPQSRKAQFFAGKVHGEGFMFEAPDLAAGDFEHLTISGQLGIVERLLASGPAILMGSSLGGYLAALCAARQPARVRKAILLAPAFGFHDLWTRELGPERVKMWRENGTIPVFHYGEGREIPLAFDLLRDAARYEAFPEISQAGLIFHGVDDPLVPIAQSRSYVAARPNVRLLEFRSGHELTDVLDDMWLAAKDFMLGGDGTADPLSRELG
jgi:pimeloyl-ACP methyl ester carboxylesterase